MTKSQTWHRQTKENFWHAFLNIAVTLNPLRAEFLLCLKKFLGVCFATNCIDIALVQVFGKNVLLPICWNDTNLLQWSTKVLILRRLCAFDQVWKSSLKVEVTQNTFLRRKSLYYWIIFFIKNIGEGTKNLWGVAPETPPGLRTCLK